jgi:hypothetical protein
MGTEPNTPQQPREDKPKPVDEVGEAARAAAPDPQAQVDDYGGTGLYSDDAD